MAATCAAYGYAFLTSGAAHLIEAFGSTRSRRRTWRGSTGAWTGTMALTEPQAGSSLADVTTRATPPATTTCSGHEDLHLRRRPRPHREHRPHGARAHRRRARRHQGHERSSRPEARLERGGLVAERRRGRGDDPQDRLARHAERHHQLRRGDDCHGWLVGEPHQGLSYMFQMMNEARISSARRRATASVAYHESARLRAHAPAGPPARTARPGAAGADRRARRRAAHAAPPEGHRRGGLADPRRRALADVAAHAADAPTREDAQRLLDLLTPVTKSFPAEKGFESNTLAVQIHGGYGYSSEYLPEAWLRDQKLNSSTRGRRASRHGPARPKGDGQGRRRARRPPRGGRAPRAAAPESAGVPAAWTTAVGEAAQRIGALTGGAGRRRARPGTPKGCSDTRPTTSSFSTFAVAWQWLLQAAAAREGLAAEPRAGGSSTKGSPRRGGLLAEDRAAEDRPPRLALPRERGLVRAHAAGVVLGSGAGNWSHYAGASQTT